jgi:hypothetical protein
MCKLILVALLASAALPFGAPAAPPSQLTTHAERSDFRETGRYAEVEQLCRAFAAAYPRNIRVLNFGTTPEGRPMLALVASRSGTLDPKTTKAQQRPVLLFQGGVHAGEIDGKDAGFLLLRNLLDGTVPNNPLAKVTLVFVPVFNIDGHERFAPNNRPNQRGPESMGWRVTAQNLNLNRDYMKLESPEAQSLVRLFNRWDPHLTVDLHTTNGSYHGYHLTYSIPLNPAIDPRIIAYHREKMMPAIAKAMLSQHKFRTYYYGNFEGEAPKPGAPDKRRWEAFTHQPRIGQNYVGFRNRLTILSEAYSYLDFHRRVEVTEAFVEEILKYSAAHGAEMSQLANQVDLETIRRGLAGPPLQMGVEYEMKPLPKPVEILLGEVTKVKNPRSGRDMTVMLEDKFTKVMMQDFGLFAAKRSVATARAYLFRREDGTRAVIEKLLQHGIAVEELTAPLTTEVESFVIDSVKKAGRPFQGHTAVTLSGKYLKETVTFPAGSIIVRAAQPLGTLAAYLLEPESDDGLTSWNFFDAYLGDGKVHPVYKVMGDVLVPSRHFPQ